MKMKEPTRKHKIPATGENWMKREMRKPFRVIFWILVVCMGLGLVGKLIVSVGNRDTEHKVANKPAVSEKRKLEEEHHRQKVQEKPINASPTISDITFEEFEESFVFGKQELQEKRKLFKNNYARRWVEWSGRVSFTSPLLRKVFFNHKYVRGISWNNIVEVHFPRSSERRIQHLKRGDWVTYQARLDQWLDTTHEIVLVEGRIIKVSRY